MKNQTTAPDDAGTVEGGKQEIFQPLSTTLTRNQQVQQIADIRFRRDVSRLRRLGDRAVSEALAQIGAERMMMTHIDNLVRRYAELHPNLVHHVGGTEFPPMPLHEAPL